MSRRETGEALTKAASDSLSEGMPQNDHGAILGQGGIQTVSKRGLPLNKLRTTANSSFNHFPRIIDSPLPKEWCSFELIELEMLAAKNTVTRVQFPYSHRGQLPCLPRNSGLRAAVWSSEWWSTR